MTLKDIEMDVKMEVDEAHVVQVRPELKFIEERMEYQNGETNSIDQKSFLMASKTDTPINIVKRYSASKVLEETEFEFNQLVAVWKQVHSWEPDQQIEFMEKFFEGPSLFNAKCTDMVQVFCKLRWSDIPQSIRANYVQFLANIAMMNPYHMTSIIQCMLNNCKTVYSFEVTEKEISPEEREEIFQLGLNSILFIVPPASSRLSILLEILETFKTHKNQSVNVFLGYFRLLITLSDKYPSSASAIWLIIIKNLLKFDSDISVELVWQNLDDMRRIFPKTEENFTGIIQDEQLALMQEKFDKCMHMILCFVSLGVPNPLINPADRFETKWMEGLVPSSNIYSNLLASFESLVMFGHNMDNVPFIWLYMCAERPELTTKLLNHLWHMVVFPSKVPNEWRKSHNAAAFLSSLLARGKFVSLKIAYSWLERMIEWCISYVNNSRQIKRGGGIQHDTFYAVVQSAFFLLCFRYKEFSEPTIAEKIRSWGIGRIVHSQLEPLNFIPKQLALLFASISRYMQLVYCSHIVSMTDDQSGIDSYFPFLHYGLESCGTYFQPLLRAFVPAENDLATRNGIMRSRHTTEVENNEYDFMEDDGIEMEYDGCVSE